MSSESATPARDVERDEDVVAGPSSAALPGLSTGDHQPPVEKKKKHKRYIFHKKPLIFCNDGQQTSDVRRYKARELIGQVFVAPLLKQRSCVIDAAAVAASADMDENGKTIKEKIDPSHVAPGEFRDRPWHVDWKKMRRNTKIVHSSGTHLYSQNGESFLDCVSGVSHVGHAHPKVVQVTRSTLARFGSGPISTSPYPEDTSVSVGDLNKPSRFCSLILETFKDPLMASSAIVCNSGSHANDIAVQIARLHTGGHDVVVFQDSFHGCLSIGNALSSKMYKRRHVFDVSTTCYDSCSGEEGSADKIFYNKPDWVHVLPIPEEETYRDLEMGNTLPSVEETFVKAKAIIDEAVSKGRKIACILTEPIFTFHSVTVPDSNYLRRICEHIKSLGGLVVIDEVQTGLGRTGHWWGYQIHPGVQPDIVTTGKPLANGHPLGLVVTSRALANLLPNELAETYKISPIQEAIGNTILEVLINDKLRENARDTGQFMVDYIHNMMENRKEIGGITGSGLLQGIKIVDIHGNPDPKLADRVLYKLRKRQIVTAVEGTHRNVIFLIPPLCFSRENALTFLKALDEVLTNSFKDYIAPAIMDDLTAAKKARMGGGSDAAGSADTVCVATAIGNETDDTHSSITTLTSSSGQSTSTGASTTKYQDNDYEEMD